MQDWDYGHVKGLICDRFDMLKHSAWREGASCSYWSIRFGGSGSESQKTMPEGKWTRDKVISSRNRSFTKENYCLFNYLKILKVKRYLEKGEKFVVRNKIIFSDWWSSFQKNVDEPLYIIRLDYRLHKIIRNGALLIMIHILATFLGQNLQVILLRDLEENILGYHLRGHLNIIPATVFPISCYFLRIKIAVTAWLCTNFLRCTESYLLEISVMGG